MRNEYKKEMQKKQLKKESEARKLKVRFKHYGY